MGIRGLLRMIKDDMVFDVVDLVEEARKRGEIEILVDFNALIRYFTNVILRKIAADYDNEYVPCLIGVDDRLSEEVEDLHRGFAGVGVRLVWVVDGPRGVDQLASDQRSNTWSRRNEENISLTNEVLEACQHRTKLPDLQNMTPIASFECALWSLKNAGAEVINMLQGMSDDFIAFEFRRRKAFAILTNDTDFVIFPDCHVIFVQCLSHKYGSDDMEIPFIDHDNFGKVFKKPFIDGGNSENVLKQPFKLEFPVVRQDRILRYLQFKSQSQMIALAILTGNDNTKKFSDKMAYHLKITQNKNKTPHVDDIATYISKEGVTSENLDSLPGMSRFMADNPDLRESIQFCKDFYYLKRIEENMAKSVVLYDPTTTDDSLTGFLAERLSKGQLIKIIYAIHLGKTYDVILPERPTEDCPPIWSLLVEIRRRVYPYLVDGRLDEVDEWRSRGEENLVKVPVDHASIKTNLIKAKPDEGDSPGETYGIDLFEDVICHLEEHGSLHLIRRYGIDKAFLCYILRYMYLLTREKNLQLLEKEFQGLFVTVFYQYSRAKCVSLCRSLEKDFFLRLKIIPSERCLIIGIWFMNIYYNAKYICGAAFNLTEEFPESSTMMNGPAFYGFYEHFMADVNQRTSHLNVSDTRSIEELHESLMKMYAEEYLSVTD